VAALVAVACSAEVSDEPPISVLLVGNSYTFSNELPDMLEDLAAAEGRMLTAELVAEGGWSLGDHANSTRTMSLIESEGWDYVVLQEQSVIPSLADYRQRYMYPAARALDEAITATGAETLLFMTWGRENGMLEEGFPSFAAMQDQLTIAYRELGEELEARVLPVGVAWQRAAGKDADLDLWQPDGSHPTVAGSYLAACVMYASIYQESPTGASYRAGLARSEGRILQEIAKTVVLDSWSLWGPR
jgi:hypothetical protein